MWFNWLADWKRDGRIRGGKRRACRRPIRRLVHIPQQAEVLENRTLLTDFLVTTLVDEAFDGSETNSAGDGVGLSLREAIGLANANGGVAGETGEADGDTIIFDPSIAGGTILLAGSELLIADDLVIDGRDQDLSNGDAGRVTINGNALSRIFQIETAGFGGSEFDVSLSNLIVTNGRVVNDNGGGIWITDGEDVNLNNMDITNNTASLSGGGLFINFIGTGFVPSTVSVANCTLSGNSAKDGGGLFNRNYRGTLNVTNSTLSGNSAGGNGGGIHNYSGTLNVANSTLSGNSAHNGGGGLYNFGTTTVSNSTLSGNSAGNGGGIRNAIGGELSVTNSTLSGNFANLGGGLSDNGIARVTNSTLSGNSAYFGGGIHIGFAGAGDVTVINSTLSGNSALYDGGGIRNYRGTATIRNSIITGNTASIDPDVQGAFTSNFHNVVGNAGSSTGFGGTDNIGTPPANVIDLTLRDNGGPTLTHALAAGSPAVNAGLNADAVDAMGIPLTTDQRGFPRFYDQVDIGAIEFNPPIDIREFLVTVFTDENDGDVSPDDLSLREAVILANADPNATTIILGDGTYTLSLIGAGEDAALTGDLDITSEIILQGAGAAQTMINATGLSDRLLQVLGTGNLTLDGITITGGSVGGDIGGGAILIEWDGTARVTNSTISGNSTGFFGFGGGIYNRGTASVTNSTLSGNLTQQSGGGIANRGMLSVTNSTLSGNIASLGGGGGMANWGTASLVNTTLLGNSVDAGGGGIVNSGSLTVANSILSGNTAGGGGGLFNEGTASVTNSTLSANSGNVGGGLYNRGSGTAIVTNSTLSGNLANFDGGGIFNFNVATLHVTNSTLSGNSALLGEGGGLYNGTVSTANVINSSLSGNSAQFGGGIEHTGGGSTLNVINSTLSGNSANQGGGIRNFIGPYGDGTANVRNSIITGNTAGTNPDVQGSFISNFHNVIGNVGSSTGFGGTDNIGTLPAAVIDLTLRDNGGPTLTHALVSGSPAIDRGMNSDAVDHQGNLLTTDQRGFPRIVNGIVDIGPYEMNAFDIPEIIVTVFSDENDGNLNLNDISLREAVILANANSNVTTIILSAGNYTLSLLGSDEDAALMGDLDITTQIVIQGVGADQTTINATGLGDRILHVFGAGNLTVNAVTLTGGTAASSGGGGIYNFQGTVRVTNATISGNSAASGGGFFNVFGGTVNVVNSTLSGNLASTRGGGLLNFGTMNVTNSTLSGNSTGNYGAGGIYNAGTLSVINSTLAGNSTSGGGGGIRNTGTTSIRNSIITGNTATTDPDVQGAFTSNSHNVIGTVGSSTGFGGTDDIGTPPANVIDLTLRDNGGPTLTHALVFASPAIDAGLNADAVDSNGVPLTTDQRGFPRIVDGTVDIGAFEFDIPFETTEIIVTIFTDENDGDLSLNDISLREAVILANADPNVTTILLSAGTYTLSLTGLSEDAALTGDLDTTTEVIIQGTGANQTTIDATGLGDRVLHVRSTGNLIVNAVTLTGGNILADAGGGIRIDSGGMATIANSNLSGNTAGFGGGLISFGTFSVTNSTLSGNSAYNGGGIFNQGSIANIAGSTLSGNSASTGGGINNASGTIHVTNSTLSGNTASSLGGGIWNNGTLIVTNSTLARNSASQGGGVNNYNGTATIRNTIITGNTADVGPDVLGDFTSNFHNVVGNATDSTGFNVAMGDEIGTPPNQVINLTLVNNGGPTLTHALVAGSPAVDAGLISDAVDPLGSPLTTDQRDTPFVRGYGSGVDIGAYERQPVINYLVTAPGGPGTPGIVQVFNAITHDPVFSFEPYPNFGGGVRVAVGDVNGDEIPDIITGTGPGGGPHIKVIDGRDGITELYSFFAFAPGFSGGLYIASADLNGDDKAEIIVGADAGGGPHVIVFDVTISTVSPLFSFFAYNTGFAGGVRVAAGDTNADGTPDIITGTGPGGGPHVRVFNPAELASSPDEAELLSFFAYAPGFAGGIYVAAGKVNNDGNIDIITGTGPGGGPHVRVFNPAELASGPDEAELLSFFAYAPGFTGGVRVAASDITGDGLADIFTTPGPTGGPHLRAFDAASTGADPDELRSVLVENPGFTGGIFLAASTDLASIVQPLALENSNLDELFADGELLGELLE